MTVDMVVIAEELAARAGFGKRKMLEIARQVTKREVKSVYDVQGEDEETYLLTLKLLAGPSRADLAAKGDTGFGRYA